MWVLVTWASHWPMVPFVPAPRLQPAGLRVWEPEHLPSASPPQSLQVISPKLGDRDLSLRTVGKTLAHPILV